MDLKITTYNIHSCVGTDNLYSAERVAGVIERGQPDIVCLQEVEVNHVRTKTRVWSQYHEDDQPALLASKVGLKYHVFAPAIRSCAQSKWKERHQIAAASDISGNITSSASHNNLTERQNQDIGSMMGKFGIAILSKYPVLQIKTHYYKRYKMKTQRNVLACLIELPNQKQVWVVNTHLGCHFLGQEQAQQAKEMLMFIRTLDSGPAISGIVVCGDFNSPPWYSCIQEMKRQGLRDLWQYSGRNEGTFPSYNALPCIGKCFRKSLRLDYMFLTEDIGIVCRAAFVCDDDSDASLASDHLPICAILSIDDKVN